MGCSSSRDGGKKEETLLGRRESELLYQNFGVLQGHYALMRFSSGRQMNAFCFSQVTTICSIRKTNTATNSSIEGFFASFQDARGNYNAHDLKLLNVLLSTGVALEKAPVLFEVFDESYSGSLELAVLETMMSEVVQMSTERVAKLLPEAERPDIEKYLQSLLLHRDQAVDLMVEVANNFAKSVTRETFILNMTKPEGSRFLSTVGVRKFLEEIGNKTAQLAMEST